MTMILGIDAGCNEVKVAGPLGVMKFLSDISEWYDRNYKVQHGDCDMEVEYKGERFFAGSLAKYEGSLNGTLKGSKANFDAKLRVLIALHQYADESEYEIVIGQPIEEFTEENREAIRNMLVGDHTVTVNGETKKFTIAQCGVAIEAGSAFWSDQHHGTVRIIDLGSSTVNGATMLNKRYVNRESFTIPYGYGSLDNKTFRAIARSIAAEAQQHRWGRNDLVLVTGGVTVPLTEAIREHFPNAREIQPTFEIDGQLRNATPVYANAIGFYKMAQQVYGGVPIG